MIKDLVIAFSGNVAYTDNSNSIFEAYYDSKAGVYSPNPITSVETAKQIENSPPDHKWRDILVELFLQGFGLSSADFSYDAGLPLAQKTINGINLRYTIKIADTSDGTHVAGFVYQDGLFIVTTDITTQLTDILGSDWRNIFLDVLQRVLGSAVIPA